MSNREYPERPLIGVGGVVIEAGCVLLVRRGSEPLRGQWSIPGGLLEAGETLHAGVARELQEETGLTVRVVELIEALDRIFADTAPGAAPPTVTGGAPAPVLNRQPAARPRYHYVILDYLCERVAGEPHPGSDAAEIAVVPESDLPSYGLSEQTLRVLHKAFTIARDRPAR